MNDVLNDALSNLEHDNYERSHKGYENRQADVALIRAALAAQPAASAEPVAHDDRLLPCPFCGSSAHFSASDDLVNVRCDGWNPGECLGAGPNCHTQADAAAAWNRRAALAAASAEPSDEYRRGYEAGKSVAAETRAELKACREAFDLATRYGRPAGDAQPVLYTTEFNGHLQTSTHATQAEAVTFARNVNALRSMDREACVVIPLYRDAPVAAQKADDARDAERWRHATANWQISHVRLNASTSMRNPDGIPWATLEQQADAAIAQQGKGEGGE